MDNSSSLVGRTAMAASLVALVACGGGGGSTDPVASNPDAVVDPAGTITGTVVVNGPVRNAVVCLDLDDNLACDAGEPTSAPTGSDGRYVITYDVTAIPDATRATLSLIAPQVPGALGDSATSIDMADGGAVTEVGFVLRQVPGKRGQINPLTTLLAVGMANGMSEAEARSNLVIQLGISAGKIDDYQADPVVSDAGAPDTARTMAVVVADTMERGIGLSLGRQTVALSGRGTELRRLVWTDADNYRLREFAYDDKAEGSLGGSMRDRLSGKSGGVVLDDLYNQAYLSPAGWVRCDDTATPLTFTLGSPNRSVYCNTVHSVGARLDQDVSGRAMGEVVNELQADAQNFINPGTPTAGLLGALGAATFPSGSVVRFGFNLDVNQPVFINSLSTDAQPTSRSTLEQLIAGRPASGVDLSNSFGSLSLGGYTDAEDGNNYGIRVAFLPTSPAVQYYRCDANADFSALSNCVTTVQGSYTISTEHGVRVMRFNSVPDTPEMNNIRLYAEVKDATQVNAFVSGNRVYQARQLKPRIELNVANLYTNKRLNGAAWAAMKAQLGL